MPAGLGDLVQSIRFFLLAVLAVALGGCFVSSDAFITNANADHPWNDSRARQFNWEDGDWKSQGFVTLRREGALYRLEDEKSRDVTRFLVKKIADNSYVAQMQDMNGTGDSSYTYALLVVDGKHIYQYGFDDLSRRCQVLGIDAAALKLEPFEDGCGVPSLAALTQIFAAVQKTQPKFEVKYEIEP
jgi:hypothetical protein